MTSRYSSRQHLIPCNKGGAHSGEYAKYICVKKECMEFDPILCEVCRSKGHRNHRVIPIRDFFTQVSHRVNSQRMKDYSNIGGVVEESERVCRESFNNLKDYISRKINTYEQLLTETYNGWRENVGLFEEHHCLQVIEDIKSMQGETDIILFSQQVKKILPFVQFDVNENGLAQPSSTPAQTANTTIKSIHKDILGLPPLSRQEVYGFQQNFLNSLKKISENIRQQLSSISFGKQKGNLSSLLNGQSQQSRKYQEDSFISQLDANATFLENGTPMNHSILRNNINQQNNQMIADISPLNNNQQGNEAFHKAIQNSNQNQQLYQVNQIDNNQSYADQINRSFLTPRGTYQAKDLLQFYRNSESASKINQHKKVNSVAGTWMSGQKQSCFANNLNNTLPESSAGIVAIDNVQKQVDDIQKSLDNLRSSFDFQKILQFVDEKSPIRPQQPQKINMNDQFQTIDNSTSNFKIVKQNQFNSSQQANFFSQAKQNQMSISSEKTQVINGIDHLQSHSSRQRNNSSNKTQGFSQEIVDTNTFYGKKQQNPPSQNQSININQTTVSKQNQPSLTFSDKFQKFREFSRSQSKENSLNNSYSRYRYDSTSQKQLQEQDDEKNQSEENRKRSLNNKKVKFQFSQDLKHEFVNVSKYIAQGQKDNYQTRMVLLEPTVEIIPHREITFSFLIKSCKSMEYGQPLALGLCHKNIIHSNNFEFPQKEETFTNSAVVDRQKDTISTAASQGGQGSVASYHGCYLLTSTGFLRNHAYSKQDMKKVPIRFGAKDVIICHFNPFRKTLKFTKKSSGESCILNVDTIPNDKLYPCVRISYAQDCVEYIHE